MARLARVVVEGVAHHVTQRGNRRQTVFFSDDYEAYLALLAEAHRRYSRRINFREGWRGYLWQGRFASVLMDGADLLTCAHYVELNPVRARLAARAEDRPWSSARAHLAGRDDGLVRMCSRSRTRAGTGRRSWTWA